MDDKLTIGLARERTETDNLKREALRLGIEIPDTDTWWFENAEGFSGPADFYEVIRDEFRYLTEVGKAGVRRLIRDEQRKELEWKQKNLEWKIKIAVSIITALTGLTGALIGVFAILKK